MPEIYVAAGQVRVHPTLPPLTVEAFPEQLAPVVNLSASLSGADWERLARSAYARADHRCAPDMGDLMLRPLINTHEKSLLQSSPLGRPIAGSCCIHFQYKSQLL